MLLASFIGKLQLLIPLVISLLSVSRLETTLSGQLAFHLFILLLCDFAAGVTPVKNLSRRFMKVASHHSSPRSAKSFGVRNLRQIIEQSSRHKLVRWNRCQIFGSFIVNDSVGAGFSAGFSDCSESTGACFGLGVSSRISTGCSLDSSIQFLNCLFFR